MQQAYIRGFIKEAQLYKQAGGRFDFIKNFLRSASKTKGVTAANSLGNTLNLKGLNLGMPSVYTEAPSLLRQPHSATANFEALRKSDNWLFRLLNSIFGKTNNIPQLGSETSGVTLPLRRGHPTTIRSTPITERVFDNDTGRAINKLVGNQEIEQVVPHEFESMRMALLEGLKKKR